MKKIVIFPSLLVLFIIIINAACTRKMAIDASFQADLAGVPQVGARDTLYVNDINMKVLRSFYRTYGEMPEARWFRSAYGFAVIFKNNRMNNTIYYKPSGVVDIEIHYYFEDQLPSQVRNQVKLSYYSFTILHVIEVIKNGITVFYIKAEDASTIKTLKVTEEDVEVMETLIKR